MKTYLQNGTVMDMNLILDDLSDAFYIQETNGSIRYNYSGDDINFLLDNELVLLYDTLRDKLFEDTEQYYAELCLIPLWVLETGHNSDCAISMDVFNSMLNGSNIKNLYKYVYMADCQFLIATIQNLLAALEDSFIRFFVTIAMDSYEEQTIEKFLQEDGVIFSSGNDAMLASINIETYFTKAYSILDIMCKICFENEKMHTDFEQYKKMKSADILWGDRKKILLNGKEGTIFEKNTLTNVIEAIRNEVVHNGTWELRPKIFHRIQNNKTIERYMLFPDMVQGHLATSKNRRHFFSEGKKINDVLPVIHAEFKKRLLNTIRILNQG